MKKIFLTLVLITIILVSCGEKKKETPQKIETKTEEVKKPSKKEEVISNDIIIEAGDNMKYNKKKIVVNGGKKVKITLKHTGKMSIETMGHNLVILKKGTKLVDFGQKANAAKETDYIPVEMKDAVIAHTKMIGGGEETTIEFDAPEAGEYDFLCSYPAHYAMMRGKFIVK